jgi:hypothetical protein
MGEGQKSGEGIVAWKEITLVTLSGDGWQATLASPMKTLVLSVLLMVGLTHAAKPEDKNVLVMDGENGGLWRSFEVNKACLGLRAVKLFDKSERESWRWALSVAGNGHGDFEVLLIEMQTKHNVFFGTNIPKGVGRACKTIKEAIKEQ